MAWRYLDLADFLLASEGDETVATIEGVAAGAIGDDEFTAWIAARLA